MERIQNAVGLSVRFLSANYKRHDASLSVTDADKRDLKNEIQTCALKKVRENVNLYKKYALLSIYANAEYRKNRKRDRIKNYRKRLRQQKEGYAEQHSIAVEARRNVQLLP